MFKNLFVIIFLPYLTANIDEPLDMYEKDIKKNLRTPYDMDKKQLEARQIRCTRRFSPGVCMEEVRPVWTYNFHLQNCTERLGCRQSSVTNRFMSYRRCMLGCQSLVHIYNHILAQGEGNNDSQWRQEHKEEQDQAARRLGQDEPTNDEPTGVDQVDQEPDQPTPDPYERWLANTVVEPEDLDKIQMAELIPADLDYRPPDFIHFDPMHNVGVF